MRSSLLRGLPPEVADDFLDSLTTIRLGRGSDVFSEGDESGPVFIVLSGRVKVTRPGSSGRESVFTVLGPGDLLGELSLLDGESRQATATAMRPTELGQIAAADMLAWMGRHPSASLRFMRLLTDRIRQLNDTIEDGNGVDVSTRVARALVQQSSRFGRQTAEGIRLDLEMNQEELALHVRASRERVNQVLAEFTRRGWIRRDGSEFVILSIDDLTLRADYRPEVVRRRSRRAAGGTRP